MPHTHYFIPRPGQTFRPCPMCLVERRHDVVQAARALQTARPPEWSDRLAALYHAVDALKAAETGEGNR